MNLLKIVLLVNLSAAIFFSCGLSPEKIKYDEKELEPLWDAISEVNRNALGFTPIDKNADFRLESSGLLVDQPYNVMLHIYGKTSRTIAFKKISNKKYVWIGEQEIFRGPRKHKTVDGEYNEEIVLNYEIVPISGHPLNQLSISYHGPDEKLTAIDNLKLGDVRPIIKIWISQKNYE